MTKTAIISLLMLAGAPALAQTTQPAGPPDAAAPTAQPATEQAAPPATGTTPADQPAPATTTTPTDQPAVETTSPPTGTTDPAAAGTPAPAEAAADPVATTVEADWAKYDSNSNASLSRTEFNKWVTDLQSAADKKAPTRSYLSEAFRKADADKSKSVSKEELATFLKG